MSKIRTCIYTSVFSIACFLCSSASSPSGLNFAIYGEHGPLKLGEDNYLDIHEGNYTATGIGRTITNVYFINKTGVETQIFASEPYIFDTYEIASYRVKIPSSIITLGINKVRIVAYTGLPYEEISFNLYCRYFSSNIIIKPETMTSDDGDYTGYQDYVKFDSNYGSTYYRDSFGFNDFTPFKNKDYYHRLDVSTFILNYYNDYTNNKLFFEDSYLEIEENEKYQLFKYVSPEIYNGFRRIKTKLIQVNNSNEYQIALDQILYVNIRTMQMSTSPLDGYVATRYFYFPRAYYDECHVTQFRLVVKGATENKYDIIYTFFYETDKPMVGKCSISKYCLTTDASSGISDYGETTQII